MLGFRVLGVGPKPLKRATKVGRLNVHVTTAHGRALSIEAIRGDALHEEPVRIVDVVVKNELRNLTETKYQIPQTLVYFNSCLRQV